MKTLASIGITATALWWSIGLARAADGPLCGSTYNTWNAPAGALVLNEGEGTIRDIMVAIGEKWTHSMLSDGANYVHHATRVNPGVDTINSGNSLDGNKLAFGPPGPSRMNVSAAQYFWGAQMDTGWFAGGSAGVAARDHLNARPTCSNSSLTWNRPPTSAGGSACSSNYSYPGYGTFQPTCQTLCKTSYGGSSADFLSYRVWTNYPYAGDLDGDGFPEAYGFDSWYEFEQYKDIGQIHQGNIYSGDSMADGFVCSTFIAYALKKSTANQQLSTYTYPNSVINPAASALHNSVKADCNVASMGILGCTSIANQVVNCFCSLDHCDDISSWWQGSSCQGGTARSISPDRLIGRGAHNGNTNSPFAYQAEQNVVFSGATKNGCWHVSGG